MSFKVSPTPALGSSSEGLLRNLFQVLSEYAFAINRCLATDGGDQMEGPLRVANYTVAGLPAATLSPFGVVYVTDEAGGATMAVSDGTDWRRTSDNAVVS